MLSESLGSRSPFQRLLIWGLGACVAAMIGYEMFFVPVRAEVQVARNELVRAEAIRDNVAEELEKDRALAEVLTREEQQFADEVAKTPGADGATEDLLFSLPELARKSGMEIERWEPQKDEAIGAWGVRRPVKVQARGSWTSFTELLRRLAELRETVAIDAMSLAGASEEEPGMLMEISFRASAVWVRSDLAQQVSRELEEKEAP